MSVVFRKTARSALLALAVAAAGLVSGAALVAGGAALVSSAAHAEPHVIRQLGINKSIILRLPAGVKDVVVGDPKVAEVVMRSRRTMYVFGRKLGQTNVYLLDARGDTIMRITLAVVINQEVLEKLLKKAVPNSNIKVEVMENQILLTGTVKTPAEMNKAMQIAKNYASSIKSALLATTQGSNSTDEGMKVVNAIVVTGKDQVMIKVKLAEVKRDVLKQFRINLSRINFITNALSFTGAYDMNFSLGSSLGNAFSQVDFASGRTSGSAILRALERDGLMRLLAEPTLTATSGEAARFHAGGRYPVIRSMDYSTTGYRSYGYKLEPVGVMLGFTPLVLSEGRISLKVNVEVSEVSSRFGLPAGDEVIPGIETRKAQTTVELPSGGTLAIAGMISEQTRQNIDGIPGLKNLPILGALFRSRDFASSQSELVVMATPYIVNPVNEKKLRTPLDRMNMATDMQTVFLGRLHRVYGSPVKARSNGLNFHGNVGFILD